MLLGSNNGGSIRAVSSSLLMVAFSYCRSGLWQVISDPNHHSVADRKPDRSRGRPVVETGLTRFSGDTRRHTYSSHRNRCRVQDRREPSRCSW